VERWTAKNEKIVRRSNFWIMDAAAKGRQGGDARAEQGRELAVRSSPRAPR
jgi:hypothetical protein